MAIINGDNNNNTLLGTDGDDQLNGLGGNDLLDGGFGFDRLDGGGGNDTTTYNFYAGGINANLGTGVVSFPGNSNGTDTLISIENVIGSQGNDVIIGDGFDNNLYGGAGDDFLDGGFGFDRLDGGDGNDTTSYGFYSGGINANLQTGVVSFPGNGTGTDTLISIENVIGSQGNDTIIGNDLNNNLYGDAGDDFLDGGFGFDQLYGGDGNDTTSYDFYSGGINANLETGVVSFPGNGTGTDTLSSIENVIGSRGNDTIMGNAADNVLQGGQGNDTLDGKAGKDTLSGGQGDDLYLINDADDLVIEQGNEGLDIIASSVSYTLPNNVEHLDLLGTANINATGNGDQNLLIGNSGVNNLDGAAGNDSLVGNAGNDVLKGGAGADKFIFANPRDGVDRIVDFSRQAGDKVVFLRSAFGNLTEGVVAARQFVVGSQAKDGNDRFIYKKQTGSLFYDADGRGGVGQIKLATFDTKPTLAATDLLIVASPF